MPKISNKQTLPKKIAALAYRIHDTGATGGIMVSPMGLQSGAEKVASAENIISVKLTPNSTNQEYMMEFLNKIMVGISEKAIFSTNIHGLIYRDGKLLDERKITGYSTTSPEGAQLIDSLAQSLETFIQKPQLR